MNEQVAISYSKWMRELDTLVTLKVGLGVADLPANDFRASYREGLTPEECFDDCVRPELEDLGFHLEIADLFDDADALGFIDGATLESECMHEVSAEDFF